MLKKYILNILLIIILTLGFSVNIFAEVSNTKAGFSFGDAILIVILIILFVLLYAIYKTKKESSKIEKTTAVLDKLSETDPIWNKDELIDNAEKTYYEFMKALSKQDHLEIQKLIHPSLYLKWKDQIDKFADSNPENLLNNRIEQIKIVDMNNYKDDEKDNYTVELDIVESEYIVDNHGNLVVDRYTAEEENEASGLFTEYWKFEREGNKWLLVEVSRSNKWKKYINKPIINE